MTKSPTDETSATSGCLRVPRVETLPALTAPWDAAEWHCAPRLQVNAFHPFSSEHRPETKLRLLHDGYAIQGFFRVHDRYVVARHAAYLDPVYEDSCVEAFLQPKPGHGYFNFEINCTGALLSSYITDARRKPGGGFEAFETLPLETARNVAIETSLKGPLQDEIEDTIVWTAAFRIPFSLFEIYLGPLEFPRDAVWRANFYKCADRCSHPHWAAWADVGEQLNFHQPDRFRAIHFQ